MTFFPFDVVATPGVKAPDRRVLFVCPLRSYVVLLDTSDPGAWPEVVPMDEATECLEHGAWEVRLGHPPPVPPEAGLTIKHRLKRDETWSLIKPIATSVPHVFHKMPRAKLIADRIETSGVSRPTIVVALLRWSMAA